MNALEKRIPVILELGFKQEALPKLSKFMDLLWESNNELNLFSRKMTQEELIDNHLIDCLLPLKFFPTNLQTAADFGTGGGLPGVLYAIQFPQTSFLLFEKSAKKQAYLAKCKAIVPNIAIAGDIPPKFAGPQLVFSRAFKSIGDTLNVSRDYFKSGGKYFLLKGRKETIDEELKEATNQFKDLKVEVIPLSSPILQVERHLVLI